jgi:hypothetical protein
MYMAKSTPENRFPVFSLYGGLVSINAHVAGNQVPSGNAGIPDAGRLHVT